MLPRGMSCPSSWPIPGNSDSVGDEGDPIVMGKLGNASAAKVPRSRGLYVSDWTVCRMTVSGGGDEMRVIKKTTEPPNYPFK